MTRLWVVVRQEALLRRSTYGPIEASSAEAAVALLATGGTPYTATGRGRYHAIRLDVWQDGTFDYTKARGVEEVTFG